MRAGLAIAVALAVGSGFAGCTRATEPDDAEARVFHASHRDDVKTWDPANAYDEISLDVVPSVYETLYQYSYLSEGYRVVPLLAADMPQVSGDRLTVTIPLRRDVRFQDDPCFKESAGKGRKLVAQDFVFALKRLAHPSLRSQGWWTLDGKVAGINAFQARLVEASKGPRSAERLKAELASEVEGIQAPDDHTLRFRLTRPYPQLLYVLAMTFTAPVPREAVEAYGDSSGNLADHPVGTGPFLLKEWRRGARVVLARNPTHHDEFYPTEGSLENRRKGLLADAGKKLPFLDEIRVEVIPEPDSAWGIFLKGKLDEILLPKDRFAGAIVNQANLSADLASRGIRLSIESGTSFYYLAFNMRDPLLGKNRALRQAISSAIDRAKWIRLFTNGTGRKAGSVLPPGVPDRPSRQAIKYDYDPARAKELLSKAGYPGGQGLPELRLDLRGADSVNRQLGEFLERELRAIGIRIRAVHNSFSAFLDKARQGDLQIAQGGWQLDYPDPEGVFQLLYGPNRAPGPNEANFDDPRLNSLFERMSAMSPGLARSAVVREMEELVQEEVPWALAYYQTDYHLSQPWLLNYRANELVTNRYKYLRVDTEAKRRYAETKR